MMRNFEKKKKKNDIRFGKVHDDIFEEDDEEKKIHLPYD
jgi:hypothetical protein